MNFVFSIYSLAPSSSAAPPPSSHLDIRYPISDMPRLRFFTRNADNLAALPAPTATRPAAESTHGIVPPTACGVPMKDFHPEFAHSEPYRVASPPPITTTTTTSTVFKSMNIKTASIPPRKPSCVADHHRLVVVKGPRNPYDARPSSCSTAAAAPKHSSTVQTCSSARKNKHNNHTSTPTPTPTSKRRSATAVTTDESPNLDRSWKRIRVGGQ